MEIPEAVVLHVRRLVPATLFDEIVAFRIIPDLPKSNYKPDVIVGTKRGELIEIKSRNVVRSCLLDQDCEAEEILLHYKGVGTLNYVVRTKSRLFIVGRDGDDLSVINKFDDVAKVSLDDESVSGEVEINLWYLDSVLPTVLNDAYQIDRLRIFVPDSTPPNHENEAGDEKVLSILTGKLSEARLNTAGNLKILREKREFRHQISHVSIEDTRHDLDAIERGEDDPVFDKVIVGKIWQRVHNEKWIIGIPLENVSDGSIKDIEVLLKYENDNIFNYTTSIYTFDNNVPLFWTISEHAFEAKSHITAVVIADSPAFKLSSIVKCKCAINYNHDDRIYCISALDIEINAIHLVDGALSPILRNDNNFGFDDVLSLLTVSIVTQFTMDFLTSPSTAIMTFLQDTLGYVSGFNKLGNILRHNKSSLHILHGTAINIVHKSKDNKITADFTVFTRSHNQLLMLINLIYDLYPTRIVIVPLDYCAVLMKKVAENTEDVMDFEFSDEINETNSIQKANVDKYCNTFYDQMCYMFNYLQDCMALMSEFKPSKKFDNSSMSINVLCLGKELFNEFWEKIIEYDKIKNQLLKDMK